MKINISSQESNKLKDLLDTHQNLIHNLGGLNPVIKETLIQDVNQIKNMIERAKIKDNN
jgi:hypothetical protein